MSQLNKKAVYRALADEDTFATVLHGICLTTYGEDVYKMDSVDLYAQLESDYGVWPAEDNENKIQAILSAVSQPYFYQDVTMFQTVCRTLFGGDPGLTDLGVDDTTLLEILWGRYEVEVNAEDIPMSDAVMEYIEQSIDEEENDMDMSEEDVLTQYERILAERALQMHAQMKDVGWDIVPELPDLV